MLIGPVDVKIGGGVKNQDSSIDRLAGMARVVSPYATKELFADGTGSIGSSSGTTCMDCETAS